MRNWEALGFEVGKNLVLDALPAVVLLQYIATIFH
jgi:hypothetical protein